jgi:hypothetical protein
MGGRSARGATIVHDPEKSLPRDYLNQGAYGFTDKIMIGTGLSPERHGQ